ncbi:MAG TPA: extracellular solute-binding protein [Actinomycetota bacterium]|jgi:trehalose transport system substrate-binding protein|nr:extracellular solute-binding protein [Actinomycetota bacterium]
MRRHSRFYAGLLGLALVATACGGAPAPVEQGELSGTTITFNISLAEAEKATIDSLIQQFQQQTGAKVNISSVTAADLPQKLEVDLGAGSPTIHLFAQDNLNLRILVDKDLVQDLGDVEIPSEVIPAMIPEPIDGTQYFLPFRPNVRVAYVNTERFSAAGASPPTTVEEFRATAEELKSAADGEPKVTLSLEPTSGAAAITVSEWILSFGGDPLVLNDEGSVAAFEFLQGVWQDDLLARESLQARFDTEVDYLRGETSWLAQNWPFTSGTFADEGILELFDVYAGWSGPERAAHVIGGDVLGIPQGVEGDQKTAALALADFLMSKETQETLAAEQAWPSIRSDAYAQVPEELQQTFDAIQGALEGGWYRPAVPYWADVDEAINAAIQQVMMDGKDAKSTLDGLHDQIASAAQDAGAEYPPSG